MKFAVVELKYVPGKTYIVPINWIKKFNKKFKPTESFLCFISLNISDEPNFDVDYYKEELKCAPGVFKIFVLKVTNTIEDAIIYQREKRLKSLPNKFRDPTNTEEEISAAQKRKRRSDKKVQNTNKRIAMVKNVSYLSENLFKISDGDGIEQIESCIPSKSSDENLTAQRIRPAIVEAISNFSQIQNESQCVLNQQANDLTAEECPDNILESVDVAERELIVEDLPIKPMAGIQCETQQQPKASTAEECPDGGLVNVTQRGCIVEVLSTKPLAGIRCLPKQQPNALTTKPIAGIQCEPKQQNVNIAERECIVEDLSIKPMAGIRCEPKRQPNALTAEECPDDEFANVAESGCIVEDLSIKPMAGIQCEPKQPKANIVERESNVDVNGLVSSKTLKVARKVVLKQQNAIDLDTYASSSFQTYIREADIDQLNNCSEAEREITHYNLCGSPSYQTVNSLSESTIPPASLNAVVQVTDIPINSSETIHTLDYADLIRALNQNMYVIPANQHFSEIDDSFENGIETASINNAADVVTGMVRPNVPLRIEFQAQEKTKSRTTLFSPGYSAQTIKPKSTSEGHLLRAENCDVDACCAIKKNYDDLLLEIASLRKQNSDLSERNIALQDALVSTAKTVPPVPFESKDGGRLYNGSIFINETQCEILDKTEDAQKYLNNLALAIFGSNTLKSSSVTGSVSNNYKKPAKPMLDTQRLNIIYSLMAAKTNCRCFNRSRINQILNKKIYNLNASGKPRKNQAKNNSDAEN